MPVVKCNPMLAIDPVNLNYIPVTPFPLLSDQKSVGPSMTSTPHAMQSYMDAHRTGIFPGYVQNQTPSVGIYSEQTLPTGIVNTETLRHKLPTVPSDLLLNMVETPLKAGGNFAKRFGSGKIILIPGTDREVFCIPEYTNNESTVTFISPNKFKVVTYQQLSQSLNAYLGIGHISREARAVVWSRIALGESPKAESAGFTIEASAHIAERFLSIYLAEAKLEGLISDNPLIDFAARVFFGYPANMGKHLSVFEQGYRIGGIRSLGPNELEIDEDVLKVNKDLKCSVISSTTRKPIWAPLIHPKIDCHHNFFATYTHTNDLRVSIRIDKQDYARLINPLLSLWYWIILRPKVAQHADSRV